MNERSYVIKNAVVTESGVRKVVTAPARGPGYDTTVYFYEFFEGTLADVLFVYEPVDQTGFSVTNAAGVLYPKIRRYHQNGEKPLFIYESYFLHDGETRLDFIATAESGVYCWKPFQAADVEKTMRGVGIVFDDA